MVVKYRQPIRPGDVGKDVLAVRHVLVKRGFDVPPVGYVAGELFSDAIGQVQKNHSQPVDRVYGPLTHAILSVDFTIKDRALYASAALRRPYVNPFAHASVVPGRIDMGVDYHGTGPITAIGKATVIALGGAGWPGGQYIHYQLLEGPHAGRHVYVAEAVRPVVRAGQVVMAGQTICNFRSDSAPGAYPGIEFGWASGTTNLTWAAVTTGYHEGHETPAGIAFCRLLKQLGAPVVRDVGPGPTFPTAAVV